MPPELLFLLPLALGGGFLVLGLWFVWGSVRAARWVAQARTSWLRTPGRVVDSRLGQSWGSGSDHARYYEAQVRYTYAVLGREYVGDRVTLYEIKTSWAGPQRKLLRQYPAGHPVTVWYDPHHPDRCALELRQGSGAGCFPAIGALFAVVGLGVLVGAVTLPRLWP